MAIIKSDSGWGIAHNLDANSIRALANGQIGAIIVKGYYPAEACQILSAKLAVYVREFSRSSGKIYLSEVDAFFNTRNSKLKRSQYFENAIPTMQTLRELAWPQPHPADMMRIFLDDVWGCGAKLLRMERKPMLFGITRIWPTSTEGLPHQDFLTWEVEDSSIVEGLVSQLGINVYIQPAAVGGELEYWNHSFTKRQCVEMKVDGSYGFSRHMLPQESTVIMPELGDMILINTTKVHAINRSQSGERITVSGFIGYFGGDHPLQLWA